MSKIKNGELDQYGIRPFKQQQFGTSGVEGVKTLRNCSFHPHTFSGCILYMIYCNTVATVAHSPLSTDDGAAAAKCRCSTRSLTPLTGRKVSLCTFSGICSQK